MTLRKLRAFVLAIATFVASRQVAAQTTNPEGPGAPGAVVELAPIAVSGDTVTAPVRLPGHVQLGPSPGLVPVRIETRGSPLELFPPFIASGSVDRATSICTTPCTLFAQPGRLHLRVGPDGSHQRWQQIEVPPAGTHVRLSSPSTSARITGMVGIATGGATIFVGLLGAVLLSSGGGLLGGVAGLGAFVLGVLVGGGPLISGFLVLRGGRARVVTVHAGVSRSRLELLRFGAAPIPGGALISAGFAF